MAIRYIFGRAGTGKSHRILEEISERLENLGENRLILIVPEQFTLQAERDLITKKDLGGIMRAEVLSFTRLAHRVFNEVGGLTRIPINDLGKNMMLRKVLDEVRKDLTIYKTTSKQPGFVNKCNELITELKQHDISPLELTMGMNEIEENSLLKMKLSDMALIYSGFDQYLQGRYTDSEGHLNLMIENMEEASFLQGAEVWIDGFQQFTPQMIRIVEKLLQTVKDVTITFPMELNTKSKDRDLFEVSHATYLKIKAKAQKWGIDEKIIDLEKVQINPLVKGEEIAHLEKELYAYPYKQFEGEIRNIEVFSATNLYTEVEHVAAKIIALVRDRGYRFKDIAVVSGAMEAYGMIIKRVFVEYGIPYFMDEKRSIMNNPAVELILAALDIIHRGYQYEDVFRFFKTGFSGLDKDEYEVLENYALAYGVKGRVWSADFVRGETEELDELNNLRQRFMNPMKKLEKKVSGKKDVTHINKAMFSFLQELDIEKKMEQWIGELKIRNKLEDVNENTQIWNIIMEIFDQLTEILGEAKVSLKEYKGILESGFSAFQVGVIPTTIDQVLVGDIERSKSHDIKALFVIGTNDGVLPSGADTEGILSDNEKSSLHTNGIAIGNTNEAQIILEQYMIYSAFTKPEEYLWISFALGDQEGRALRPSILIDRLRKLFKGLNIQSDVVSGGEEDLGLIATPNSTFKYLVESIRSAIDEKHTSEAWKDVYHWYYQQTQWDERRQLMIEGLFHENQVVTIGEKQARKLYDTPLRSSVSRLERFVNCPFSHFISYGLRPQERKEYEVKAPHIGNLLHQSIEDFSAFIDRNKMLWKDLDQPQCDELVEKVIEEIVPTFENGVMLSTHRYQYLVNRLKRISKKAVWTLTEHLKKGNFVPQGHEVAFGHQIPSEIVIQMENGEEIHLQGRVDRVDVLQEEDGTYVKIIDYKSGDKKLNLSDVYHGFQLQLMVYLEAMLMMQKNYVVNEVYPAGVFYYKIDDPMIKTTEKAVEEIEREINKKLKLKGLVLKDLRIIKEMDQDLEKHSYILPVSLTKDGEIGKKSSVLSSEEFQDIMGHVKKVIKEIGEEILKGTIKTEPCKRKQHISCQYCSYMAICQFDSAFEGNKYKTIKEMKPEEVLEKIKQGKEGKEDDQVDNGSTGSHRE